MTLALILVPGKSQDPAVSTWELPKSVASNFESVTRLHSPRSVLATNLKQPVNEMSVLDLYDILTSNGWKFADVEGKQDVMPFNVETGNPNIFYVKSKRDDVILSRLYLIALAMSDIVKEKTIEHFKPDAYYKSLFEGDHVKRKQLLRNIPRALEDDIGVGGGFCAEPPQD